MEELGSFIFGCIALYCLVPLLDGKGSTTKVVIGIISICLSISLYGEAGFRW